MSRAENGFNSYRSGEIFQAQLNVTLSILDAIPPMSSRDSAESREIEAVDRVRKDRIDYLVKLANTQARWGNDPTEIVEKTLPHVDLVWGTFSGLDYYLQFAKIQHGFGNNARNLWDKATQIAAGLGYTGFSAEAYAKIASSKANSGLDQEADHDFNIAIGLIRDEQEKVEGHPIGEACASTTVGRVAYNMLNHHRVNMAREAIGAIKGGIWKELMESELEEKIAETEFMQKKGLAMPQLSDSEYII